MYEVMSTIGDCMVISLNTTVVVVVVHVLGDGGGGGRYCFNIITKLFFFTPNFYLLKKYETQIRYMNNLPNDIRPIK